jgi:hypothetical protein
MRNIHQIKFHYLVCCLIVFQLFSCKKDELTDPEPLEINNISDIGRRDSIPLLMEYDIVTASYVTPANPSDWDLLTDAEKVLGTPKYEGRHVVQMVNDSGLIDADIEMMDFEGMPDYPKEALLGDEIPSAFETDRIEVRAGQYQLYNSSGDKVSTQYQSQEDIAFFKNILSDFREKVMLSNQEMDYMITALEEIGFEAQTSALDSQVEVLEYSFADGRATKLYFDKRLQEIVAREQYDAEGELRFVSGFIHEPSPSGEAPKLVSHHYITFFESPFSGVKMAIKKTSYIKNFDIQTN